MTLGAMSVRADDWDDHRHGGSGGFMIGWGQLDLGPLNDQLVANGYSPFREDFLTLGGGGHAYLGRFVIGGQGHAYLTESKDVTLPAGNFSTDLSAGMGFVDLGWVVYSTDTFSFAPMVGLGGGGLALEIDALSAPTFEDVLDNPGHRSRLETGGFLLDLGLSAELVVTGEDSHGGPVVGIRAGWVLTPIEGDWAVEGREVLGGPDLGVTGPYVRLLLGFGKVR